ncbi:pilus assembly PilX family protein [Onishia niordana]|uniref:pilus assembly PilX family protein n=1 Tax=Onishia niordana TaxID=2508711 RepID=UPI00197ADA0C|nr:pilus assembly protein [Halomonas niordiana]
MALIVSLIFLLLLSLLAVSSVQDATLQERMVSNQRDHAMAFQAAEAALKAAEEKANSGEDIQETQWDEDDGSLETISVNDSRLSRSPRYHIWHPPGLAGQAGEGDDGNNSHPIYQINAVGYGGSPNSRVVIQSWYIPDN